ncbi:hypothetical protein BaRGS_00023247 [Batillaria attramentaria]|uniref:Uncharacterized protein n=1 Tax=Batillaria attramentaria TaxID=370345 RepID=A0ABD0KEN1_9CAEN
MTSHHVTGSRSPEENGWEEVNVLDGAEQGGGGQWAAGESMEEMGELRVLTKPRSWMNADGTSSLPVMISNGQYSLRDRRAQRPV